jgi:hypothetical protein
MRMPLAPASIRRVDVRARGLAIAATSLISTAAAAAPATAYTIRLGHRNLVSHIGPWSMRSPSLRRAIKAFGPPSSERAVRPGFNGVADCGVMWSRIGLRVVFTTLGLEPGACNPNKVIYTARLTGDTWRTWRGLRIGDRSSQIRIHHPKATIHHGVWWLATTVLPFGNMARVPTVSATTHGGRVKAFELYVQAQGE